MFQRPLPTKSNRPCEVCSKRKVKCDRLVPCGHCRKRGTESECVQSAISANKGNHESEKRYLSGLLRFWQSYEYWIPNIGLFKSQKLKYENNEVLDYLNVEAQFWESSITETGSYKLLNYTIENLGTLYFGCIGDVTELYKILEQYWDIKEDQSSKLPFSDSDKCYSRALLWSIFTMGVYYCPKELLDGIISIDKVRDFTKKQTLTEEQIRCKIYEGFITTTIDSLYRCNFMAQPDIRFIQTYIILSTTLYSFQFPIQANMILTNAMYVTKLLSATVISASNSEDIIGSIANESLNRLWYRICACDYIQEGPNKSIDFNRELGSLLKHAAYLEDLPSTDVYKEEDNYEILFWKLLSLDRDIDQYLNNGLKPPPKTLDAVQREVDIYTQKVSNLEEDQKSINSKFEKFLGHFILYTVSWKIQKLQIIFYDNKVSLNKLIRITKNIIKLLVKNFEHGHDTFNKHPLVIYYLSRVATFTNFYHIFENSVEIHEIVLDINELIVNLPPIFGNHLENLKYIIFRFTLLRKEFGKTDVVDTGGEFQHPVFKVLQNDVATISKSNNKLNYLLKGLGSLIPGKSIGEGIYEEDEDSMLDPTILEIVSEFEEKYPIDRVID